MKLVVGNTSEELPPGQSNPWRWKLYFNGGAAEFLTSVELKLHPTFPRPVVTLTPPLLEFETTGWGTFSIGLRLTWTNGLVTTAVWPLQLGARDASIELDVPAGVAATAAAEARPTTADAPPLPPHAATAAAAPRPAPVPGSGPRDVIVPLRKTLQEVPFLEHTDPLFFHGRLPLEPGAAGYRPPRVTWRSAEKPRDDHECPGWLTASEYEDDAATLDAKCAALARLIRASEKTVCYTGAGISASVIGQAARSGSNTVGWKFNPKAAVPTPTHHALGELGRRGLVHSWVQQNHDGLPQKAGFPQERINEVHGSWYDPSNPVVKYSGSLHDRAYPWMVEDAETADLVLVLGTSLSGLNADQVATKAAARSRSTWLPRDALGTVMINLQQTPQDGKMTLRINGRSDAVLACLLKHLGIPPIAPHPRSWPKRNRALVPYDADGRPTGPGEPKMWLDLSPGAAVKITSGNNIQGSEQPLYMHIGHPEPVYARTGRKSGPGVGKVLRRSDVSVLYALEIEGVTMSLGLWWLDAAERGAVPRLPVVNTDPDFKR